MIHPSSVTGARALLVALFVGSLTACGGGDTPSGGASTTVPVVAAAVTDAKVASSVVVVPDAAVKDFSFTAESNTLSASGSTTLAVGSVVKVGDRIVKITSKTATAGGATYEWDVPTLDEAYDEINYAVPLLEVKVPVQQSTRRAQAAGFDCKPGIVLTAAGAGGMKVDCKAPLVGNSVLTAGATLTLKYEDVKIVKTGRGSPATQEWKLTVAFEPEVGLRWGKGDKLSATPADKLLKAVPECAAAGLLSVLGRPLSTPPAWRYPLGTVPLATVGLLTVSVPTCVLVDVSDSSLGLDILGKGKWKLSVVKLKDADGPTIDNDFAADLTKAAVDSIAGVNATVVLKGRLELTPMLHFGFVPVSGLYLNPGLDITAKAKATALKQGVCASVNFKSDIEWWATGVATKKFPSVQVGIASDKLLLGDTCDPAAAQTPPPTPTPPAVANCGTTADFDAYLATLPAFASVEMRGIVDAARRDAATLIPNLASPAPQLSSWVTGLEAQTGDYRNSQAGAELVYQQFSANAALSGLCQRAALAPSGVDLLDSIAIAWGGTRIGIAMNTWGINQLRCKLNGNNSQAVALERFCPY